MSRAPIRAPIRPPTDEIQAALERDLIEWADDVALRLVWADLLQIDGDPLGRLIVLDHFGEKHPEVRAEAEALREQLRDRLETPSEPTFTLHWERGFVQTLEVRPRGIPVMNVGKIHDALRRPALRFLERLHVIVPDEQAGSWPEPLLRQTSHMTLREVHIGDPPRIRDRPAGAYETRGRQSGHYDCSKLGESPSKFPRLRWISIEGELARLVCRDGGGDTRTHHVEKLAGRPLTSRNRTALIRAIWDTSGKVQEAAFKTIAQLGPRAEFVLDDLELLLRPPIRDGDPRQAQVFQALAAIGEASASLLPRVLAHDDAVFIARELRCIAFLGWLRALGHSGRPALKLVDKLLASKPDEISSRVRGAAKSARKAMMGQ